MTGFTVWMRLVSVLAAGAVMPGEERLPEDDQGEIAYREIQKPEEAPERIQPLLRQLMKPLPEGTRVRIGIGQFYDFGHSASTYRLEPALRSFVPLDEKGCLHGEEAVCPSSAGRDWRVAALIPWVHGVRNGMERQFQFLEGGQAVLAAEVPWTNGVVEGVLRSYHPDGKIRAETTYRRGIPDGKTRTYDEGGNLLRESAMKNGLREGEMKDYWPGTTRVRRVVPYRRGKVHGTVREYYRDGALKRECGYQNDLLHGEDRRYAPDGTLEKVSRWKEGREVPETENEKK